MGKRVSILGKTWCTEPAFGQTTKVVGYGNVISCQLCGWLYTRFCLCVCDSACNRFCKQDILQSNLWIFAKFVAHTPYTLPWKWLTFYWRRSHSKWLRINGPKFAIFIRAVSQAV